MAYSLALRAGTWELAIPCADRAAEVPPAPALWTCSRSRLEAGEKKYGKHKSSAEQCGSLVHDA